MGTSDYNDETGDPNSTYYYHIIANLSDGTKLDYGTQSGNQSGDARPPQISPNAVRRGNPNVTLIGTATKQDGDSHVNILYNQYYAEASLQGGVFVEMHDVFVSGVDRVVRNEVLHLVTGFGTRTILGGLRSYSQGVYLAGGSYDDSVTILRKVALANRVQPQALPGGSYIETLQDGTILTVQMDGTWGKLEVVRPGDPDILVRYCGSPILELWIENNQGNNNAIDRIDNLDVLVEEKDGRGPDDPDNFNVDGTMKDSYARWASSEIYDKMDRRLALLLGLKADSRSTVFRAAYRTLKSPNPKFPYSGPDDLPAIGDVLNIKKVKFELKGSTPGLIAAVEANLALLRLKYAQWGYTFTATYGNQ